MNYNRIDIKIASFLQKSAKRYIDECVYQEQKRKSKRYESEFKGENSFTCKLDNDLCINLYKDSFLSKIIYNGFEEDEIIFVKKFLQKGDVFIDVGANIGLFSLIASRIVGEEGIAYSFEPTPETYRRLNENVTLNNIYNITTINKGVSDTNSVLELNVSTDGLDAWNSFSRLKQLENSITVPVETITLDSFVDEHIDKKEKISLVKIDVEGWELNVLKGAINLLSQKNAPVLMIEFTEENAFNAGVYCGDIYDFAEQFGYKWYIYDQTTNQLIHDPKRIHYPYDNLFAVKDINAVNNKLL